MCLKTTKCCEDDQSDRVSRSFVTCSQCREKYMNACHVKIVKSQRNCRPLLVLHWFSIPSHHHHFGFLGGVTPCQWLYVASYILKCRIFYVAVSRSLVVVFTATCDGVSTVRSSTPSLSMPHCQTVTSRLPTSSMWRSFAAARLLCIHRHFLQRRVAA